MSGKLKAIELKTLKQGNHSDGNNLFLRVQPTGARSWVFRYKINDKAKEIGLGSLTVRTLAEARELAIDMKRAIHRGENPKALLFTKATKTFTSYAAECIQSKRAEWRNPKHAQQWFNTLETYVYPFIGDKSIETIETDDVIKVLEPIWTTKTETATRVRQRIEAVLDYAYFNEKLQKANPARWRGHLEITLPKPNKIRTVQHFEAIPYIDLPNVMKLLRSKTSMSSYCVRWIALTACRSNEARSMVWDEINQKDKTWTIPPEKMKAKEEHRVPLTDECLEVLNKVSKYKSLCTSDIVFFNEKSGKLSDQAVSKTLKSVSYDKATVHGLRSSFKDFAHDKTTFAHEVIEKCLAHSVGAVEKAYRKTDLIGKRRELMNQWGDFLRSDNQ